MNHIRAIELDKWTTGTQKLLEIAIETSLKLKELKLLPSFIAAILCKPWHELNNRRIELGASERGMLLLRAIKDSLALVLALLVKSFRSIGLIDP